MIPQRKTWQRKKSLFTGDVAQQVGQDNATNIINQAKLQIIGDNIQNADEIYNIVNNIAVQNGVTLTQDELDTIVFPFCSRSHSRTMTFRK